MPFPIGDLAPRKLVEQARFSPQERQAILGKTARSVFRLRPDCC
jgi:hypothetical protein